MSDWLPWVCAVLFSAAGLPVLVFVIGYTYYRGKFLTQVIRIFEEKPLFVIPRGQPDPAAQDVSVRAVDGTLLRGCYLRHRGPHRRGVILFGLEFGSNRWSAGPYCEAILAAGYDVFALEPRNQGDSEVDANYQPLQWVTDKDVADARAALTYLKRRPDADPRGVGYFGVSKGGSVGWLLASEDAAVRCVATDGAYAAYTTMVPYMRRWAAIYTRSPKWLQDIVPDFFYGAIGLTAIRTVAARRRVRFPWIERALSKLKVPALVIHGEADTYIKPDMTRKLFALIGSKAKDLWLVAKAKHNQAIAVEPAEYESRLVDFFETHLGDLPARPERTVEVGVRETLPAPQPVEHYSVQTAARELAPMPGLAGVN